MLRFSGGSVPHGPVRAARNCAGVCRIDCLRLWQGRADRAPHLEVVIQPVVQRDVEVQSEWIGTTEGAVDAEIRAQVSGYLISRNFEEGTLVGKDSVLFRIDPRPYQAALELARADLGRAEAALGKADLDVNRFTPLVAEGAISRQELDNAIQFQRSTRAGLGGAKASVEKAEPDLAFSQIRSPVHGVAGIARAQLGDLVGPGDPNPLTNVSQLDPIRVSFPLSEREYLRFAGRIREIVEGREPANAVALSLVLADGSVWPHLGRVVPAASSVDQATGTFLLRGEFANPENLLRPGQYARIRGVTATAKDALLVRNVRSPSCRACSRSPSSRTTTRSSFASSSRAWSTAAIG